MRDSSGEICLNTSKLDPILRLYALSFIAGIDPSAEMERVTLHAQFRIKRKNEKKYTYNVPVTKMRLQFKAMRALTLWKRLCR